MIQSCFRGYRHFDQQYPSFTEAKTVLSIRFLLAWNRWTCGLHWPKTRADSGDENGND